MFGLLTFYIIFNRETKRGIKMNNIDFSVIFPTFRNSEGTIRRKSPANTGMEIIGAYDQCDEPPEDAQKIFLRVLERAVKNSNIFRYILIQIDEGLVQNFSDDNKELSYIIRISSSLSHLGIAGVASREISVKMPGAFPFFYQTRHEDPATIANAVKYFDDGRSHFSTYAQVIGAGFVKLSRKEIIFYGKSRAFMMEYDTQINYQLGMTCHEFCQKIFEVALSETDLFDYKINSINNELEAKGIDLPEPE